MDFDFDRLVAHLITDCEVKPTAARNAAVVFKAVLQFTVNGRCRATREEIAAAAFMSARSVYNHLKNTLLPAGLLQDDGHSLILDRGHNFVQEIFCQKAPETFAENSETFAENSETFDENSETFAENSETFAAHVVEVEEIHTYNGKVRQDLAAALENLWYFEEAFSPTKRDLVALLLHVDDPTIENWWIDRALMHAIASARDNPVAFINSTLIKWRSKGGPPDLKDKSRRSNGTGQKSGFSDEERSLFQR